MMRRLIRDEGLLCGGSSGAAVACALQAAATLKAGQRCVVILPDSVRNYMTKALSDDWMLDHGFVDGDIVRTKKYLSWWAKMRVCDLPINTPLTITADVLCKDAISLLKREGFDMVPVLDDGNVIGVVTEGNMTNRLLSGRCNPDTTVADAGKCETKKTSIPDCLLEAKAEDGLTSSALSVYAGVVFKTFHKFSMNDTLADVASALDHDPYVLIVSEQRCFSSDDKNRKVTTDGKEGIAEAPKKYKAKVVHLVSGIVTRIDLLDFIARREEDPDASPVKAESK